MWQKKTKIKVIPINGTVDIFLSNHPKWTIYWLLTRIKPPEVFGNNTNVTQKPIVFAFERF